jgi:hypothetical protein
LVLGFLKGQPQVGKVGNNTYATLILNMHVSNSITMFADETTVLVLITNNVKTAYREEGRALAEWCQKNTSLNVNQMKELIMDFRRQQRENAPIHLDRPQWRG